MICFSYFNRLSSSGKWNLLVIRARNTITLVFFRDWHLSAIHYNWKHGDIVVNQLHNQRGWRCHPHKAIIYRDSLQKALNGNLTNTPLVSIRYCISFRNMERKNWWTIFALSYSLFTNETSWELSFKGNSWL